MSGNSSFSRYAFWLTLTVVALIAGGLAGSWATARSGVSPFGAAEATTMWLPTASGSGIEKRISFDNGFEPVVKRVLPSVVNISSSKIIRSPDKGPQSPLFSDPFFQQFFGSDFSQMFRAPQERREHSLGSGVIVSADGHILTNNHVVDGANEIKISLTDEREFTAHVVGTDPKTDVAVLKVDAKDLPLVTFGDSSKMEVGHFVIAVGNPFGIGQTVTMGIVSATGRSGLGIEDYEDFIQTDAPINPGNSGGAMVNVRGELIGINTAIISGGGGNEGVGFAIPVNMARGVMDQILKNGKVTRGWLGVSVQTLTAEIAKAFGIPEQQRGVVVTDVSPDSPASRSGLTKGDVIQELNGEAIHDSRSLSLKISMMAPQVTVRLKVRRGAEERDISAVLAELPAKEAVNSQPGAKSGTSHFGLSVEPLTPQLSRQLGLSQTTKGVVLSEVQSGSAAEEAGLQRGDVVEEVNHKSVTAVDQFQAAVSQAGNQPLLLLINRGGSHLFVVVPAS
jgi:serine protease Do